MTAIRNRVIIMIDPVNDVGQYQISGDPTTSAGMAAGIGSIATRTDTGFVGVTYIKTGAAATAWALQNDPNSVQTGLSANGITAAAAGGQGPAIPLTCLINRVATSAAPLASLLLPVTAALPAGASATCTVINDGANSVAVFPAGAETINGQAASASFVIPAGQVAVFSSVVASAWVTTPAQIPLSVKFTLNATAGPTTAVAGDLTGADKVFAQYSGVNASTLTVRTAAQMIADAGLKVGQSFFLRIANSAAGTCTLTTAAGVTLTGHVAIATNTAVDYIVTVTAAGAITFQSCGTVVIP